MKPLYLSRLLLEDTDENYMPNVEQIVSTLAVNNIPAIERASTPT